MLQYRWLRNVLRNKFQRTVIGKIVTNLVTNDHQSICFVSATRLSERDFWCKSLLGRSLRPRLNQSTVKCRIAFDNTRGLPEVYNEAILNESSDILVFLHDDLWLEDAQLIQKIRSGLKANDVIGVAGNIRRVKKQPAWLFVRGGNGQLDLDRHFLSGSIKHGAPGKYSLSSFGPAPLKCELMDGVFLAVQRRVLVDSCVRFDEQFKFDFYDLDFCRSARKVGLSLSTWPIDLIHQSSGMFGGDSWSVMESVYFKKWNM